MNRAHNVASSAAIAFARLSRVAPLGLVVAVLVGAALPASALVIENSCPDSGPSQPMPKRVESGCDDPPFPSGFSATGFKGDPRTGEFFIGLTKANPSSEEELYYGLTRADHGGALRWSYVVPRGELRPSSLNSHRFIGTQSRETDAGRVFALGVYSDTSGTMTAVFEWELPIADRRHWMLMELEDGTILLALDKTQSLVVLALSPTGKLLWSKEYSSAEFAGTPASDSEDLPQPSLSFGALGGNSPILCVHLGRGRAALMRLDAQGELQWARKLQVPGSFKSYGAGLISTRTGAILLSMPQTGTGSGFNFKTRNVMLTISADGDLEWGRSLEDVTLYGRGEMNDAGEIVLSLSSVKISRSGVKTGTMFALMDSKGEIPSAVRIAFPRSAAPIPILDPYLTGDRIYYYARTSSKKETYDAVIGSSSYSLTDFRWLRYNKPVAACDNGLALLPKDRLLFWAHSVKPDWTDFAILNGDLTETADCKLFSPTTATVSKTRISVRPVEARMTDMKVEVKQLPLTLKKTDLVFKRAKFSEKDLCQPER